MAPTIKKVVEGCIFAEGPHWDEETQSLYFIDVRAQSIERYVPATQKYTRAVLEDTIFVSLIIPVRGQKNKFLVSLLRDLVIVTWDGESDKISGIEKLLSLDEAESAGTNFNDGKCDPSGRLWIGTMGTPEVGKPMEKTEKGGFYSLDGKKLKNFLTKVGISNGLAFNTEPKKFYHIDTFKGTVDEFDFDVKNGLIDNRKIIFTLSKHDIPGLPDGMTIDIDGNLWVAIMGGSRVIKINPRIPETLLDTVFLPTAQVTSVAFGGKNLDELYVTTGKPWEGEGALPDDGTIFQITGLNVRGTPGISVVL